MERSTHINFLKILLTNCCRTLASGEYLDIGEGVEDELNNYFTIINPQFTYDEILEASNTLEKDGFGVAEVDIPKWRGFTDMIHIKAVYRLDDYINRDDIESKSAISLMETLHRVSKGRYRK